MKKKKYVTSLVAALLLTNISIGSSFINFQSRRVYAEEVNDATINAGLSFLQNFIDNNSFMTIASQLNNPPFSQAMSLLGSLTSGPIFTCSADNVLRVNSSAISSIVANFSVKYPNTHLTSSQVSGIFDSIADAFNEQSAARKQSSKNLISSYCTYEQPVTTPTDPETPTDPVVTPTNPVKPTDPVVTPTNPVKPTGPVKPADSAVTPTNPSKPADSVVTPTNPADQTNSAVNQTKSTDTTNVITDTKKSTDQSAPTTEVKPVESTTDTSKKPEDTKAVQGLSFIDVDKNSWARDAIAYLSSKNIIKGINKDGTKYNPKGNVTRAEFITIIVRALNLQNEKYAGGFKDVENSKWYADFVATASKYGIAQGDSNQNFNPDKTITKEEIAKVIVAAYELKKGKSTDELLSLYKEGSINDISKASSWAGDYIKIADSLGIISGNNSGEYMPKSNATREEVAKMIYNLVICIAS